MLKSRFKLTVSSMEANVLPPIMFLGMIFMGADFVAVDLAPLRYLKIPYPRWMDYGNVIAPAICAVLWLSLKRKWPRIGTVIPVLLCGFFIVSIPQYAESRIAKVPVKRFMTSQELKSTESQLGFPIFERGSSDGEFAMVAPNHEQLVRRALDQSGLLIPDESNGK